MGDWFDELLLDGAELNSRDGYIFTRSLPERLGINLHENMHGSHLRKLQNDKFKLAYYETPYYKNALFKWLDQIDKDKPVLDVGAGDGRFTELLIKMGFKKIVATDVNLDNLRSLDELVAEAKARDHVRLVQCDLLDSIFKENIFSVVLSIGVLYYLNEDYEKGKEHLGIILEPGGLFIESEPDLEGQAIKALIFDEIDIFANILTNKQFTEVYEGQTYKLRLFDKNEMRKSFHEIGMTVIDYKGLSIFPLLFVIARARGLIKEESILKNDLSIHKTFNFFNDHGDIYKHVIWLAKKME